MGLRICVTRSEARLIEKMVDQETMLSDDVVVSAKLESIQNQISRAFMCDNIRKTKTNRNKRESQELTG